MAIPTSGTWPVSLDDAKAELNIPSSDTANDTEMQGFVDAITSVVENIVGPVNTTSFTEVHDGGWPTISLRRVPVTGITTMYEYVGRTQFTLTSQPLGSTLDNYGYSLDDPDAGLVVRRSGWGSPIPFMGGPRSIVVTYTAGRSTVPADVRLAALDLIRLHWVSSQRGFTGTFGQPGEEFGGTTILGFFVPNRVLDLLQPHRDMPGIA